MQRKLKTIALYLCLTSSPLATAQTEFSACVDQLKTRALKESISQSVVEGPLASVAYVPRVIELDRKQPEFSLSFYKYYTQRVTPSRVEKGRALLKKHHKLLKSLEKKYGVPAHYLVSFWGMETNFGGYLGKMNTLDSLATLACDQRRSEFFTRELLDALRLIDSGVVDASLMKGSWAGAMGNMQFMPSTYRQYGLDADRDGDIDMWNSLEDAFTSAAHYLNKMGWQKGWRWGREVILPDNFNYALAGRSSPKALRKWASLVVKTIWQHPVPKRSEEAALIVPAGHNGPAFLAYDNFNVIMRWNRSEFYALSVGLLADRINGSDGLTNPPPKVDNISLSDIKRVQKALNTLGYDAGGVDGIFGAKSKRALRQFQSQNGLIADGFLHDAVMDALFKKAP